MSLAFFFSLDYHPQVSVQVHPLGSDRLDLYQRDALSHAAADYLVVGICAAGLDRRGTCSLVRCELDHACQALAEDLRDVVGHRLTESSHSSS